jgi:hypothetical protein
VYMMSGLFFYLFVCLYTFCICREKKILKDMMEFCQVSNSTTKTVVRYFLSLFSHSELHGVG